MSGDAADVRRLVPAGAAVAVRGRHACLASPAPLGRNRAPRAPGRQLDGWPDESRTIGDTMSTTTLADWFQRKTREDGSAFYSLADEAPAWLYDAVREAHDDEAPNDWRYDMAHSIVSALDDGAEVDEVADSLVDVYTGELLAWLAGDLARTAYVNEAVEEGLADVSAQGFAIDRVIAVGQFVCIDRMVRVIVDAWAAAGDIEDDDE